MDRFKKLLAAILTLSRREKIVFWGFLVIALTGTIWWSRNLYVSATKIVPDYGGFYTEGVVGNPKLINPVLADANEADGAMEALIFSGLFRIDGKGGIEPDLAELIDISENRKEYLITLKPDLFWHDGERLTVDDVLFTIDLIKNPALRNPYALNWQGVMAEKISDQSLRIKIPAPYEPFLQNLTFRVLPKHLWKDIPTQNFSLSDLNLKPIGSGPYRFKHFEKDKTGNVISYTLVPNKKFHLEGPYLETIMIRFYPSYEEAILALKKKEIDGLAGIPPRDFKEALAESGTFKIITPRLPRYFAVFWQSEIQPFNDIKMREALTLAVNKDKIVSEVLGGRGKIVHGPITDGLIGGGGSPAQNLYNPASSTQLLDELGWKDSDSDGVRDKTTGTGRRKKTAPLEFELFTPDTPALQAIASLLIHDWQAVGVKVVPKPVELAELLTTIQARSYRAVLFGQVLTQTPDPFSFWHSSQKQAPGLNLSLWSNKKADEILEKVREMKDDNERKKLLRELQSIIAKDYAALFLYSPDYIFAIAGAFKLSELTIINSPPERLHKINEWHLHTKRAWK